MPPLQEKLTALTQRLQIITLHLTNQDDPVEPANVLSSITNPKYICTECAWTTSANAQALARHFISKHSIRLKCPSCNIWCISQDQLEKHQSQKHRHLCPACQMFFATVDECKYHEPCATRFNIAFTPTISSPTVTDQAMSEKALISPKKSAGKRGSVQSGFCPDPGCQLTFLEFDTLYQHYIGSHPLSIPSHDPSKPFKCPFCSRRYLHDRFVRAHVRTHKPKSLSAPGIGDAEDQESLIQQSRITVANREAKTRADAQAETSSSSKDSIEEVIHSAFTKDGFVHIDEGAGVENANLGQSVQVDMQESQLSLASKPIGLVFQARPVHSPIPLAAKEKPSVQNAIPYLAAESEQSDSMDLDDDYPERFALDEDELPLRKSNRDPGIIATQVFDGNLHQKLLREVIRTLHMQHFVNLGELIGLVTYFLNDSQRMYFLNQLGNININQHDSDILAALHGTVLKDLIDAWVDFKRLAIHFAPQLIRQAAGQAIAPGKSFTLALLQYCLKMENIIYRNETNIAHHFLRDPPADALSITADASFPQLIAALRERVKNRLMHDSSAVFTNEMVLRGMRDYVNTLQMVSHRYIQSLRDMRCCGRSCD